MAKWNKEQEQAIKTRKGNFLISASAGSGKTTVLSERVYGLIKEGVGLDELLILTFTNLAATNMREKIRKQLMDDNLSKLASMLDAVNIQTFDAFALYLVKKYYFRINLRSDIKLIDEAIIKLEEKKILESIFNRYYEEKEPNFLKMISYFSINNDDDVKEAILNIYKKAQLCVDVNKKLLDFKTTYLTDEFLDKTINKYVKETISTFIDFYENAKSFRSSGDYPGALADFYSRFIYLSSYDELAKEINNINIAYPDHKKKVMKFDDESDKPLDDYMKDEFKKIKSHFAIQTVREVKEQILSTKPYIDLMVDIAIELNERLITFKDLHNAYTFSDIFRFAIKLAEIKDIQESLKKQYRYIMVDEYQDTNDLQEYFINLFANDNVFSVGDVKQSIYRFRNANPDIFLKKFNEYQKYDENNKDKSNVRIDLPKNYRSASEVLDLVNEIFNVIMPLKQSGLNYKKDHQMDAGNPNINKNKEYTSTLLNEEIRYELPDNMTTDEYEARLIASDILRRIKDGEIVKNREGYEKISYKNFTILISKKTKFNIYQKVFEEYKIPLFANYNIPIHESDLTLVLESIIKALSNLDNTSSNDFKHAMFSILRSFLFSKKEDYIENLIITNNYEDDEAYKILKDIKARSLINSSLKSIILDIINSFKFNSKIILIGDVNRSLEIMENYIIIATNMDELNYSLEDFNEYFNELKEFDIEPEFNASEALEDSVKLMSIHASKGLEFNYVYLPSLAASEKSNSSRIFIDNKYGVTLPTYNSSKETTLLHDLALKNDKRDNLLEKIRLFYVALTRAQEKVIFLVNKAKLNKEITSFEQISTFLDMYRFGSPNVFVKEMTPSEITSNDVDNDKAELGITIKDLTPMSKEVKEKRRASKESESDEINAEALELGNKFHYYLELIDFKNIDTSFIKDKNDKFVIDRFLKNDIFKQTGLVKSLHEYSFYDEMNDINGFIDLLLVYNDHVDIVDFKLSNIDDKEYDKQLNIYKDYVKQITSLPIRTFVTSIFKGDVREVNNGKV